MSRRFFLAALLAVVVCGANAVERRRPSERPAPPAEWEKVSAGAAVQALACLPGAPLFGTATSGVYTIGEDGTPAPVNDGIRTANVTALAIAPNGALFAAVAGDGIYRASGITSGWQKLTGAPATATVLASTFDAIYAGGCDGLFASANGGTDWVRADNGLGSCVRSLASRGSDLYAGTASGLFRSSNGGASWLVVSGAPANVDAVAVDPLGRMFIAVRDRGVFRSSDGLSWVPQASAYPMTDVRALFITDALDVYAATERGVLFRSSDSGATWTSIYPGVPGSHVAGLCATSDAIYVAGGGAAFRTPAAFRVFGLNFGPYKGTQDPNLGATVTDAQIADQLRIIRQSTGWIRTFGSSADLLHTGSIAHGMGLRTAIGAWLARDSAANELQIQNLIATAKAGDADLLIVGSEVLLRSDLTEAQLIAFINRVRQAAPGVPVAYADTYVQWLAHPNVVNAVDVLLVNYYPYWEGISAGSAMGVINAWHRDVLAASKGRPVIVSEAGWPSAGGTTGDAVPSLSNANAHFAEFVSWARATHTPYFYFEAFDEPWKAKYEGSQGAHWGVWDEQGRLKSGMSATLAGATVADNWSSSELAGGPGTPSLELTSVPLYGHFDDLRGRVQHVNPYLYKVLVYIYVSGWWIKPYANHPLTTIAKDGTWICDVTTGGIDETATRIDAFLVRSSFQAPILLGASAIPSSVTTEAVAAAEAVRTKP